MGIEFPTDPKQLRKFNFCRYRGIPPSWELIEQVIEKSGLKKYARFEYAWLIPRDMLVQYKVGTKPLPAKYWHIFYEFDVISQKYAKTLKNNVTTKKRQTNLRTVLTENKNIINGSKQTANFAR